MFYSMTSGYADNSIMTLHDDTVTLHVTLCVKMQTEMLCVCD